MTVIMRENVEVSDTETEIIEPQETDKEKNRIFAVSNGENEAEFKVFGSNDKENWEERGSQIIEANGVGTLVCGPTVWVVKLVGKTTTSGQTSIVDACLMW